jgi:Polysaccharide lyase
MEPPGYLDTSANMRQTYSAKIRFHDDTGSDGYVFELFQAQEGGPDGGYSTHDGQGPVARFLRKDGHVYAYLHYDNENKVNIVDLGAIKSGAFHTYGFKAVWSHDPSVGRLEVYLDGKLKKTITGRDVNLGPNSNRLPMMKLGLYGDYAVGRIDVDNVKAGPSSSSSPAPSVALSGPANVQLVSGQ